MAVTNCLRVKFECVPVCTAAWKSECAQVPTTNGSVALLEVESCASANCFSLALTVPQQKALKRKTPNTAHRSLIEHIHKLPNVGKIELYEEEI